MTTTTAPDILGKALLAYHHGHTEAALTVHCNVADDEPVTQRHGHGHDHLICTACGAIVEFESDAVDEAQARVVRRHGFEVEQRRLEIYGRCATCRRAPARKETV